MPYISISQVILTSLFLILLVSFIICYNKIKPFRKFVHNSYHSFCDCIYCIKAICKKQKKDTKKGSKSKQKKKSISKKKKPREKKAIKK